MLMMMMKKKKSTQRSACFFKIMIGDFRQFLFIPPKFASTIGGLIMRELYLRDANGHSWKVKLTMKDGYLVFRDGWRDFVLDHSITSGEFVVFKYRGHSVFTVQIFGTDACERTYHFSERNRANVCRVKRKVTEVKSKYIVGFKRQKICEPPKCNWKHGNFDSVEKGRREITSSGTLERASGKSREVSCDMVNKGGDLKLLQSGLETKGMNEDSMLRTEPSREAYYQDDMGNLFGVNEEVYKFLLTTNGICYIYDEDMKHQLEPSMLTANNILLREKENQEDNVAMPRDLPSVEPTLDHKKCEKVNKKSTCEKISTKPRGQASAHISRVLPNRKNPVIRKGHFKQSGRVPDGKYVNEKNIPFPKGYVDHVKLKTVDVKDIASPAPAKFRFSVSISAQTSWLALPGRLSSHGGGLRLQRKVIVLRDPCMRLWPVLYNEGFNFVGFFSGWEPFAAANNIRKGDICEFEQVADGSEFTLQVQIS